MKNKKIINQKQSIGNISSWKLQSHSVTHGIPFCGPHTLTGQHSSAVSGGMDVGELARRAWEWGS